MRRWIVTFGGAGLSPVAPGTAGSLLASVILFAIYLLPGGRWCMWTWSAICAAILLLASIACVALGPWAIQHYGRKDPGAVVVDEAAGIALTMLFLPTYPGWQEWKAIAAAFAAFRIFDILKPPPARQLEKLPAGWGILADDLMAAVYANITCQLLLRLATNH